MSHFKGYEQLPLKSFTDTSFEVIHHFIKDCVFMMLVHPRGISPTRLKLDSSSPGAGFIPIISTKGINQTKKGKL